jgi:nitrogen fixation NifU-like protein
MQGLDDLYREVILDHYRTPHGADVLEDPAVKVEGFNPLCGDELLMEISVDDSGRISGLHIQPNGCSISVASASMLAQQLAGKTVEEAVALKETFKSVMRGEPWPEGQDFGDLEALEGVKNFPVRIKCALLAWMTLEQALAEYDPALAAQVEADDDIEVKTH